MDIKRVHEINLILLNEIDRICKKYNIKYRLEAGTMLGAVRHKGFIPWDDDCDVAFMRTEYEKFLVALEKEKLTDGIVFVKAQNNKNYFHDFINRLFYVKEIYREGDEYKNRFGGIYQYLWVDIFILDRLPKEKEKSVVLKQKIIYGLSIAHRYNAKFKKNRNLLLNLAVFILKIFGKLLSLDKLYVLQEKLSKKYSYDENIRQLYFSNYPPIWLDYKFDLDDEKDIIYTDFENVQLPIIRNYDKLLTYYYGDYMTFPPVEKQIPEHLKNIW